MIRSVLAVVAGYLTAMIGVTTLFAFVLFVAFGGLPRDPGFRPPGWLVWLELGSAPVVAALAGYVCAWIARRHELRHALVLVAVMLLMGIVSALGDQGHKPLWSSLLLPALAGLGVLAGARLRVALLRG